MEKGVCQKESVTNTLTAVNNDIELFFLISGEKKFDLFYKKCVHGFMLYKKSPNREMYNQERLILKQHMHVLNS